MLSIRTIRNVELAAGTRPRTATLKRIADALNMELAELGASDDEAEPRAPTGFVGRGAEIAALNALLARHPPEAEHSTVILLIGAAGVGKTSLAMHWAALTKARFPGGQAYVNLRGLDPTGNPMGTTEALRCAIDQLTHTESRSTAIMTELHARYLSLLAGQPVLLILDNARDVEQVRPLLPGTANCLVLITSRDDLIGLVVHEAAHPLIIDLPNEEDATGILRHHLGDQRLAAEPQAIEEILQRTARLPLALEVVAARAAARPELCLSTVVAEMRRGPLAALTGDAARSDVRGVFSWSYTVLTTEAQRAYRLMSLHPGPDASVNSAAALLDRTVEETQRLLTMLARAHLLSERTVGRFAFHDLLRAHAMELAATDGAGQERRSAERRVMDHYLHTAVRAYNLMHSDREPISLNPAPVGIRVPELHVHRDAFDWFERERAAIADVIRSLARQQRDTATWQLAWCYGEYLERQGPWTEWVEVLNVALSSTRRIGNKAAEAGTLRRLGGAFAYQSQLELSLGYFLPALVLYEQLGDVVGTARVHMNLAYVAERQGRPAEVLTHSKQALTGYCAAGDQRGQARALNAVGYSYALLGQHRQTLSYCGEALRMLEQLGVRRGRSATLHSLGYAHLRLGELSEAIPLLERAIRAAQELGNRSEELLATQHLATALDLAGQPARASAATRSAKAIGEALGQTTSQPAGP